MVLSGVILTGIATVIFGLIFTAILKLISGLIITKRGKCNLKISLVESDYTVILMNQ
jgi:hypothetical protein